MHIENIINPKQLINYKKAIYNYKIFNVNYIYIVLLI